VVPAASAHERPVDEYEQVPAISCYSHCRGGRLVLLLRGPAACRFRSVSGARESRDASLLAHAAHQLPFAAPVLITIVILAAIAIRDGRRHDAERTRSARTDERNATYFQRLLDDALHRRSRRRESRQPAGRGALAECRRQAEVRHDLGGHE
jgi:hypothetical protein